MSGGRGLARRPRSLGRAAAARSLAVAAAAALLAGCLHEPVRIAGSNVLAAAVATLDLPEDAAVLVGGGDIADCEDLAGARATAELIALVLARAPEAVVFTTGDHAYPRGTPHEFTACYAPTWGRFNARTAPTPGNHDYETPGASGYFAYFDAFTTRPGARPTGYYAFEHGGWLVVVLNSLLPVEPGSVQVRWLEDVLARSPSECVVAIWHHPRRSSGFHGYLPWDAGRDTAAFWDVLQRHGADIVLNGHDHLYERFARLDGQGRRVEDGLRQFTVGTGGAGLHPIVRQRAGSEYLTNGVYGVLVLVLRPDRYDWAFVGVDGVVHDRSRQSVAC
ncbi:MAG TPA: metallophosphoesterase [Gammaproteobacteria bacterium]